MMKKFVFVLVIILSFLTSSKLIAQEQDEYDEIILDNKIYKPGSNWVSLGTGLSYNFDSEEIEKNINVSYHQRIKEHYFNVGYHAASKESFIYLSSQKLNDLYFGYGWRREKQKTQQSLFIGASYSWGGIFHHNETGWLDTVTTYNIPVYRYFTEPGIYIDYSLLYKFYYDVGLGTDFYISANRYYQVAGIRLCIYFSGAYKGKID